MKFSHLKSLAHNIADSMASGIGLLVGVYDMDVFGEAAASNEGYMTVDFLNGVTSGATPTPALQAAILRYRDVLPSMCHKHGVALSDIETLLVRFGTDAAYGRHFKVTVKSRQGKTSTDQYLGSPGRRLKGRHR